MAIASLVNIPTPSLFLSVPINPQSNSAQHLNDSSRFSRNSSIELLQISVTRKTAGEGLIDRAKVQPGQKVLVYGETGGVGHIGLQLAKWAGATVYTLVSSEDKAAIARQLGADVTINYRQTTVEEFVAEYTDNQGFDVVFDTIGNDNLQNAFKAAKLNGTVASLVALSQQDLTLLHAKGLTLHLV